jgi:hypothetical protein
MGVLLTVLPQPDVRLGQAVPTYQAKAPPHEKGTAVKYMIMLYGSQQDYDVITGKPTAKPAMPPEEISAMHAHMEAIHKDLEEAGELVFAQGLTAPVHARRVRLRSGAPVVTDGPYPETQEVLAGYTIVECDSFDRATEIAARVTKSPAPRDVAGGYIEVRPIIEGFEDLAG